MKEGQLALRGGGADADAIIRRVDVESVRVEVQAVRDTDARRVDRKDVGGRVADDHAAGEVGATRDAKGAVQRYGTREVGCALCLERVAGRRIAAVIRQQRV